MIDVVYVLGTGSQWSNNEIRFSLRSIEKNLSGVRNIYVIGEKPDFFTGIIHIPYPDELGPHNADGNIIRKVLRACREKDLSDLFLFINDDHLVLKPMEAEMVLPYQKGDMTTFPESFWKVNPWRHRLKRTRNVLKQNGHPTLHFDCHTPIVFDKSIFPSVMERFDYYESYGYTMKSLYGNLVYQDGPYLNGEKQTIFTFMTLEDIERKVKDASFMSFNDFGLNKSLKLWLHRHFPEMSRYEQYKPADRVFEIADYLRENEDPMLLDEKEYQKGVEIFEKYSSNKNLKKLFGSGYSQRLAKKLIYKLRRMIND